MQNAVFLARHGGLGPQGGSPPGAKRRPVLKEQNVALLPLSELMGPKCGVNANEQFSFLLEYESYCCGCEIKPEL